MSTSFFVTKKLNQDEINKCKECLDRQDFEVLKELLPERIEICHRAGGWELLWYAHNFKHFDKSKESLFNFLKASIISDEYGKIYTFDEFYEEIKDFLYNGLNYETYYSDGKHSFEEYWFRNYGNTIDGVKSNKFGEFYIDNLRFINE